MPPLLATTETIAHIARLRSGGWSVRQIADALSASPRQVFRWAAGTSDPLPVFARALAALPTTLPCEAAA